MTGATPQKGAQTIGRVHAALGLVLGAYVVFHLWQQWPALLGRAAWLDRARTAGLPSELKALLLAVALGHVLLGALRLRRGAHPADASATAGLRRLQLFFGALVLLFLSVHVPLVRWSPGPASTIADVYARLTDQLGRPGMVIVHLLGITAVCGHLGLGLGRAAVTLGLAKDTRLAGYVAGAFAAIVLFGWLQVFAWYAIGEPLVPIGVPTLAP